ncbi:MAG: Hsp70 family protein [Candidatus Binatia bacterium]|nr:Hsp70 family protein [Candidatus Binatia bacterium]
MIGLDFGTTNSAVGAVLPDGTCELASFPEAGGTTTTFRSVLHFPTEADRRTKIQPVAGPMAIQSYLDEGCEGRFLQSLKSHLASRLFTHAWIFGWKFTLEDLVAQILTPLRNAAVDQFGVDGKRALIGRPVHFVAGRERREDAESDARAEERLRAAARRAGFEDIELEYEPVAAASEYERTLDHDELVLIGDFGGGTSDFCLVRLGPSFRAAENRRASILGVDGVAVAGDAFDGRIVRHVVAPRLGLGTSRRSLEGRELPMPGWIYSRLERWEDVSFLAVPKTMETLRRLEMEADEPTRIQSLIELVEQDLGYLLYRAVEAAKCGLSDADSTSFEFDHLRRRLRQEVRREELEEWLTPDLDRMASCVDRLTQRCGIEGGDVDRVFLTGGSSRVPCVRDLFASRFGRDKLRGGRELTTVARGLALLAAERR